ncbi:hypothetical protein, partial [Bifidobacterium magnum]|uniref:hypothetical protein n=1 Tax=Bifidobacterium magnum TaxID=1692 RepID=UPI001EE659BD
PERPRNATRPEQTPCKTNTPPACRTQQTRTKNPANLEKNDQLLHFETPTPACRSQNAEEEAKATEMYGLIYHQTYERQ